MKTHRRPLIPVYAFATLLALALPAAAHLEKINLGLYGGYVADIAAIENATGDTEVLIAVDSSQRGVFKWDSASSLWSSITYPTGTVTGEIPGAALQVEGNPNSPTDVYTVITSETDMSALYVSDSYGDVSTGVVSFSAAMTDVGDPLSDVNALVGSDSGIYAGTTRGEVWLNAGSASNSFTSVFSEEPAGRVLSLTVTSATTGYVLMEDSVGTLSLWSTNWSGSNTDLTSMLPAVAPVEVHTGGCPIDDCDLDVHRVAADPADATGLTLYIAGSSINGMAFLSTDGGATWNSGWDYQCSLPGSGCESFGLTYGYPSVILFQDVAASGTESRFVYISTVARDNDAATPSWDPIPNLSSTITPSGPTGPIVIDFTTHANDSALAIDPNDGTILYVATDLAIGQIEHTSSGFPEPSGSEMGNARGIEGVVINDMDFFENSSTDKDLWIATKSGLGKGLNFDPTDPTSTEDAGDWVYPIFPRDDGAPPSAVAINPLNSSEVLAGNGKVYRNEQSTSLPEAAQAWALTFDPSDFAGPGEPLESDRADRTKTTAIEYQQQGSCDRVYMTAANEDTGLEGGVFYSDDGGENWTIDDYNTAGLLKMPVNALWTSQYTVWIGVGDKGQETPRSSDTGMKARLSLCLSSSFWTPSCGADPVITQMQSEVIVAIDGVAISGDDTVYIASLDHVYKGELNATSGSGTGFCSWTFTDVTPPDGEDFTSVAVDTADAAHVWASFGNCIQESTDGGTSWADYSDSCQPEHEFIRKLVFDDLLSGTANGLFAYEAPEPSSGILGLVAVGILASLAQRRRKR